MRTNLFVKWYKKRSNILKTINHITRKHNNYKNEIDITEYINNTSKYFDESNINTKNKIQKIKHKILNKKKQLNDKIKLKELKGDDVSNRTIKGIERNINEIKDLENILLQLSDNNILDEKQNNFLEVTLVITQTSKLNKDENYRKLFSEIVNNFLSKINSNSLICNVGHYDQNTPHHHLIFKIKGNKELLKLEKLEKNDISNWLSDIHKKWNTHCLTYQEELNKLNVNLSKQIPRKIDYVETNEYKLLTDYYNKNKKENELQFLKKNIDKKEIKEIGFFKKEKYLPLNSVLKLFKGVKKENWCNSLTKQLNIDNVYLMEDMKDKYNSLKNQYNSLKNELKKSIDTVLKIKNKNKELEDINLKLNGIVEFEQNKYKRLQKKYLKNEQLDVDFSL